VLAIAPVCCADADHPSRPRAYYYMACDECLLQAAFLKWMRFPEQILCLFGKFAPACGWECLRGGRWSHMYTFVSLFAFLLQHTLCVSQTVRATLAHRTTVFEACPLQWRTTDEVFGRGRFCPLFFGGALAFRPAHAHSNSPSSSVKVCSNQGRCFVDSSLQAV
jgi:hypothetical protein